MNTDIYCHNKSMNTICHDNISAEKFYNTNYVTKIRDLVYCRLYGSVGEQIKNAYSTYCKKSSNPKRSRFSVKFMVR